MPSLKLHPTVQIQNNQLPQQLPQNSFKRLSSTKKRGHLYPTRPFWTKGVTTHQCTDWQKYWKNNKVSSKLLSKYLSPFLKEIYLIPVKKTFFCGIIYLTRTSSTKAKTVYGELVNVTMSDTDQKEPKKVLHRKKHKNSRLGAYGFSCSVYWFPTLWVTRFDVVKKTSNHWLQWKTLSWKWCCLLSDGSYASRKFFY